MKLSYSMEVLLLLICVQRTTGAYHVLSKTLLTSPNLTSDSHFGYSITYQATTRRLIVGAPKANVFGQVYTVNIDSRDVTPFATPQIIVDNINNITSDVVSHKNFLLGASVEAGPNFFVMCAPKATIFYDIMKSLRVLGLCFYNPTNGTTSLLIKEGLKYSRQWIPYGWSLEMTTSNAVIVGAPGSYEGIVKVVKKKNIQKIEAPPNVSSFFGYSFETGNYFDKNDITSLYYAISTPHGSTDLGEVFFFNAQQRQFKNINITEAILGSLFGASLCTANLGGTLDHLLVGAPTYTINNIIDRGVVYLYAPNGKNFTLLKTIEGPSAEAYFGNSLANLGDMDGDYKDEVAIGAPYEDLGRGAVYIYSGAHLLDPNKSGKEMLLQRIQPEPNSRIRSFGFSLTAIQDYDDNGCNELAVGAPGSNHVVLYNCYTYITLTLQATVPTKNQSLQTEQEDIFTFPACFQVQFPERPEHINENICVRMKIFHKDVWFWTQDKSKTNTMSVDVTITGGQTEYCHEFKFSARKDGNFNDLLSYTITTSLRDDPHDMLDFNSTRVLLSAHSILTRSDQISLAECESKTCTPKLTLNIYSYMSDLYVLGSNTSANISFEINSWGDTAYTACFVVKITGAPLLRYPVECTGNEEILTCSPGTVLSKGTKWETGNITIDTRGLTSKNEEIHVSYELYNQCNDRSEPDAGDELLYNLISSTDGINITGASDLGNVVAMFGKRLHVRHIYTIMNSGLTTWEDVSIDIVMTKNKNMIDYKNIYFQIEDGNPVSCQITKDITEDAYAKCNYVYLKTGTKVNVIIPFIVSKANDVNTADTLNVSTIVNLHLKNEILNSSVVTKLEFKTSTVPEWIIVTAVLLSTLLVLILGYALFSLGFLKRKKKGQLKDLKKSVYKHSKKQTPRCSNKRDGEEMETLTDHQLDTDHEHEESHTL